MAKSAQLQGIEVRHQKHCRTREGGKCNCEPSYRAYVNDQRAGIKRRGGWTQHLATARSERLELLGGVRHRTLAAPSTTLRAFGDSFLDRMASGEVRNRSGKPYKPSVCRSYRTSMERHVYPDLGAIKLTEVSRADLQNLVDRLSVKLSPSTLRNAINALRAIYRYALSRDHVKVNPTIGLMLPAVESKPTRIAAPAEMKKLIAALKDEDRPFYAVAAYAGLRIGEIKGLRWSEIDLSEGEIRVMRNVDPQAGEVEPKSAKSKRTVPVISDLKVFLLEQRLRTQDDLVFPGTRTKFFSEQALRDRAVKAWEKAGLEPIGMHECRHTFVSTCIAAGVDIKTISEWAGHSSVAFTLDRYGHLLPGSMKDKAAKLDAFVASS